MTTTLATPAALAALRGITYDPTDLTQVLSLEAASDVVRGYCGQTFDYAADETIALDGSGTDALLLPQLPVTAVSAITEDDVALVAADWVLGSAGVLYRLGGGVWPRGRSNVDVTYSHGYVLPGAANENLPADLQLAVLQIAARVHANPDGRAVSAETVGSYSVTYGGGSRVDVLPVERAVLDRYRVRRVV